MNERITQRVLFRVAGKGAAVDVLECGHVLTERTSLSTGESHLRRECGKCESGASPEMESVLHATRGARERVLWEWWASSRRGTPLPPEQIRRILRAS